MPEFALSARPAFRPTAADRLHAETVARHIEASGRTATPTLVLRVALARAAIELAPSTINLDPTLGAT